MQSGIKGHYDCIREFSELDYSDDLKKIDDPILVTQGDDDQIVPNAALKVYPPARTAYPHHQQSDEELLEFVRG